MGLREYHRKRDFAKTPEPRGEEAQGEGWSFVVQKHAATQLHYDFRLELEGVLKSWAVPKGPSYDTADKRLAMHTEDHPLDYGSFEGVIPKGEYGGGAVLLWDRGTWTPVGDPHQGYRAGNLKFKLEGQKLRGGWALVRIRGRDARDGDKTWLLVKEKDDFTIPSKEFSIVDARPESVTTGRSLEEIAAASDSVWHSHRARRATAREGAWLRTPAGKPAPPRLKPETIPGARKGELPRFVTPQLATLVTEPPEGDGWLHEMKFDGYRILCRLQDGQARLLSRNGKDWTASLPSVARAAEKLPPKQALLDGEAAVVLADGTTSFQALQNAMSGAAEGSLVYFVFDLLHLDGQNLTRVPLEQRKAALQEVLRGGGKEPLRFSDHVVGKGRDFFDQACRLGAEGIVSKDRTRAYEPGRGRGWLKVKCLQEQEFVIGGYTEPAGSRVGIGALLVGVHDEAGTLQYAGKVGTGYTDKTLKDLRRRLAPLEQKTSPFAGRVAGAGKARWVKPELVAEVRFTEWTGDGRLRHPSFQGLREDKPAREIFREKAKPTARVVETGGSSRKTAPAAGSPKAAGEVQVAGVRLTHPDRVLYPAQGTTKRDLALFYESIADWILPHLKGRPLTLVRCPEGAGKSCFYVKHSGVWTPETLRRVQIQEKRKKGEYLVVDSLPGLIGLVQMGILEIHTWNAVAERLEKPDRLVFDLDPGPGVPWERVVEAARRVRSRLEELGLYSFVKTTGGKGLHVVVPLSPSPGWEEGLAFARALAESFAREDHRAYTSVMSKAERKGKIFIDYLRNNRGATSVAAYSTRVHAGAPVSTPLAWDELEAGLAPDHYTIRNLKDRLASLKKDPWAAYGKTRQAITASMKKRLGPT